MFTFFILFLVVILFPKTLAKKILSWTTKFLANNTGDSLAASMYKKATKGKSIKFTVVNNEEDTKVG